MSKWCLVISVIIFVATIVTSLNAKNNRKRSTVTYYVFVAGTFIAATTMFIPIYAQQFANGTGNVIKTILISVHNTMRLFVLDGEFDIIKEFAEEIGNGNGNGNGVDVAFSMYAAILYVIAPLLTFGVVLSFFKNAAAYRRYIWAFGKDAYIFSELNEESIALAKSIARNEQGAALVFTDVFAANDEVSCEQQNMACSIGGICFKQDILFVNWGVHSKRKKIAFFIIGKNEDENIVHTKGIVDNYRARENTSLYLFSESMQGELATAHLDKGKMRVRRINEARSIVRENMYSNGTKIFDSALICEDGCKEISAVIVGLSDIGKEMLKGLSWLCQMDGYHLTINAFDSDRNAENIFVGECPELMSDSLNGKKILGECEFDIRIHSGIIPGSAEFTRIFNEIPMPTYVLVALNDEGQNVKQAVFVRTLLERRGAKDTFLQTIVRSSLVKDVIENASNFKGQAYNIDFIGDVDSTYSDAVIMKSELEAKGLRQHMKYPGSREDDFWNFEYNYQSSISLAIHMKMRKHCNISGADKSDEALTPEEKNIIERLEHNRWNAYVRSEGYVYSGSPEKSSRNDLGKMHNDLRPFDDLPEATKRLDSFVGTE